MANSNRFSAEKFINAIPGTGGIISTIAKRVGCDWHTAKRYIVDYPTIRRAYNNELEMVVDVAEGVLIKNIESAARLAQSGVIVDAADIKWFLARKARTRGYGDQSVNMGIDLSALSDDQLARLAKGDDVYSVLTGKG
jgi:hypothetical protein